MTSWRFHRHRDRWAAAHSSACCCYASQLLWHYYAGTGRTGFLAVPPNNYPFYNEFEKYVPVMQADGGQLSGDAPAVVIWLAGCFYMMHVVGPRQCHLMRLAHGSPPPLGGTEWKPMYHPTPEQAEADRAAAYAAGVPHGYVPAGNRHADGPTIRLTVISELVRNQGRILWLYQLLQIATPSTNLKARHPAALPLHLLTITQHDANEYGENVDSTTGQHSGGPFTIDVSPSVRVEELRRIIRDRGGIIPALQRLSYAGRNLEDAQRTLEQ